MDDFCMNSPPKPQRHVTGSFLVGSNDGAINCGTSTARLPVSAASGVRPALMGHDCIGDFEGQMVDRAVSDLPDVFTEVFSMQKGQSNEIQKQQTLLEYLKVRIDEGNEKKGEIEQEVSCVTSKTYLIEEAIKNSNTSIKLLDSEIKSLIKQVEDKQVDIARAKVDAEAEIRKLSKYKEKVTKYTNEVQEYEKSTSSVYSNLQEVKDVVETLKTQQEALDKDKEETEFVLSGVVEKELQSEIDDLKTQLLLAGTETKDSLVKISQEQQRHKQISQTILVLEKRNTAQLTRLKGQAKELQMRNRQRQSQVNQLKDKLTQAVTQLE